MGRGINPNLQTLNTKKVLFSHPKSSEKTKEIFKEEKKLAEARIITGDYEKNGEIYYWRHGSYGLHRENDLPAKYDRVTGLQEYYIKGKPHREGDLPALIAPGQVKMWMLEGLKHREEDKPAVIFKNGAKQWFHGGVEHRDFLPAFIDPNTGFYRYSYNGETHRDHGPALKDEQGNLMWYQHGKLHREDGPAIEMPNGEKHYYLEGEFIGQE